MLAGFVLIFISELIHWSLISYFFILFLNLSMQEYYIYFSLVKQLIASKIKVFVNIIYVCVCCVYLLFIYKDTHTHVYIHKNMLSLYIKYIYI